MDSPSLTPQERQALGGLAADLGRTFGPRLLAVAAYGLHVPAPAPRLVHSIALVERLTFHDLAECAPLASGWRRASLAVPLILEREEFLRTLDVFPLEYGDIVAHHVLVAGSDLFAGARVAPDDVRRACEMAAKSHLIHLREGFLEAGGDPQTIGRLISASAPPFRALLANIARLADDHDADVAATAERQIGIPASVVREVLAAGAGNTSTIAEPTSLLSRYIDAAERVWEFVDTWRAHA
jgi:hypothetical protein